MFCRIIIEKPIAVKFKNENVESPTKIECGILFYTEDENAIVHLGIKEDKTLGYYIPKTFFVEKIGADGVDVYIDKQKKIIVTKKNRVIMLYEYVTCGRKEETNGRHKISIYIIPLCKHGKSYKYIKK